MKLIVLAFLVIKILDENLREIGQIQEDRA